MKKTYKHPDLKTFGSVQELTAAFNKIGTARDSLTGQTGIEGDFVSCGPCTNQT